MKQKKEEKKEKNCKKTEGRKGRETSKAREGLRVPFPHHASIYSSCRCSKYNVTGVKLFLTYLKAFQKAEALSWQNDGFSAANVDLYDTEPLPFNVPSYVYSPGMVVVHP